MKEIKDIVAAFDEAQRQGMQTALATVVHVDGSSYRRAGARMLIAEDGKLTGAISGGCLEGDALRKALLVINEQKSMLVTYDTTDEDDAKLGVGLGCNGIIHILIEPIAASRPDNPVALFTTMLRRRQRAVIATLFSLQNRKSVQPGTCLLYLGDQVSAGNPLLSSLQQAVLEDAGQAFLQQSSCNKTYTAEGHNYTAFIEHIHPSISLVAVGAGNDVMPLGSMAHQLGWEFTAIDGRGNYATRERFPAATRVLVARPEEALKNLPVDDRTVFALMTHNYQYDLAMLRQLLSCTVQYIGVLGPKKKLDRMLGELREEGMEISSQQLQKIYGPVGLDIGAETAEEIALSVLAEIKAVLAGKNAGPLRAKGDAIHPRSASQPAPVVVTPAP